MQKNKTRIGYARAIAKIPFFLNVSVIIIGIYFFVRMLSMAQEIILPLLYSSMFAVMLSPLVDMLERRKVGRLTSIMGIMIVSVILAGLLMLLLARRTADPDHSLGIGLFEHQ
jgi:predicted PurR-regulated permease PerM